MRKAIARTYCSRNFAGACLYGLFRNLRARTGWDVNRPAKKKRPNNFHTCPAKIIFKKINKIEQKNSEQKLKKIKLKEKN